MRRLTVKGCGGLRGCSLAAGSCLACACAKLDSRYCENNSKVNNKPTWRILFDATIFSVDYILRIDFLAINESFLALHVIADCIFQRWSCRCPWACVW